MTIHERIKKRRIELGISAYDLAKILGVSKATIYRYESAEIEKLPTSVLTPLAKALHTTPAYLMGWDEKKPTVNDELDEKINDAFNKLSDEKKQEALNFLRFLQGK